MRHQVHLRGEAQRLMGTEFEALRVRDLERSGYSSHTACDAVFVLDSNEFSVTKTERRFKKKRRVLV